MDNKNAVNIELSDSVVTPNACCLLVTQLIKYILYQKQVIPDPVETLKFYIAKRKDLDKENDDLNSRSIVNCLASERYFKKVSDAVDTIDSLLTSVGNEISKSNKELSEVILLLGSTPINPQDVFRIVIPSLTLGHSDTHHSASRIIHSLMKNIFTNEILNQALTKSISKTANVYIVLKKRAEYLFDNDNYIQKQHFHIPARSNQVEIVFRLPTLIESCKCIIPYRDSPLISNKFQSSENILLNQVRRFFEKNNLTDLSENSELVSSNVSDQDENEFVWYQNKLILKSFQKVEIKGNPIVNFWINPSLFKS